jgi:adenylosuccinate synthase
VAYKLDGKKITHVPSDSTALYRLEPVYETFPGWLINTDELATGDLIPDPLQKFMNFITKYTGAPISLLGVGTKRRQMVELF